MNREKAKQRAKELVAKMTVEEKVSQILFRSPAIERLGVHEYNWWNEACHGVAMAGTATVFPQTIGLAATFDPKLMYTIADAVSTEGRAKYNKSVKYKDRDIFKGLTYWTPNINIFRDPRWGRGQETYGEDPFLTATMGCACITGLQGDGEFYKAAACAKHFAVHSGPEKIRHQFNAVVDDHDLWETYLPAFEWSVKKAKVAGVMGAYSAFHEVPCCVNKELLKDILRDKWGFDGYLVTDDHALNNIWEDHKYTNSHVETAALALKVGCDVDCSIIYENLMEAYRQKLVTEEEIDRAVQRAFTIRHLLGEFEENRPYSDIPFSKLDCKEHRALNLKAAEQGIVLLKNDGILPLQSKSGQKLAVVGPNSMSIAALEGNYNGRASEYITVADGIRREFPDSDIRVEEAGNLYREGKNMCWGLFNEVACGVATAEEADVTILCLGLDREIEREEVYGWLKQEEHDPAFAAVSDGGDKTSLKLPNVQQKLAKQVCDACDNVIIVVMAGSCIDLGDEITQKARAIIHAWYPGALGGLAVSEIISGKVSPCGRLPVTFYRADNSLPEFTNYAMDGRTYRYIHENPRYPFGYGLSYTRFAYGNFRLLSQDEEAFTVSVDVKNIGNTDATEKVQVYARYTDDRTVTPNYQLCGLNSVDLQAGEEKTVTVTVDRYWVKAVLADGERVTPNGEVTLYIGGHQPDAYSTQLLGDACLSLTL